MAASDPTTGLDDRVPKRGVFADYDDREADLQATLDETVTAILEQAEQDVAAAAAEIEAFLGFLADCHDYSARNSWLLYAQARARGWHHAEDDHAMPTVVGGASFWKDHDRWPAKGEKALYVWRPIFDDICPDCGYGAGYDRVDHGADCDADPANADKDPDVGGWEHGVVTFVPAPVFDVSQTAGEALPDPETKAVTGADEELIAAIRAAFDQLGIDYRLVEPTEWETTLSQHGYYDPETDRVSVKEVDDLGQLARTLIHEGAHALCHADSDARRVPTGIKEVEADGVAYVVGTHFGLAMDGAARYIARWCAEIDGGDIDADGGDDEDPRVEEFRALFGTIGDAAATLIEAIEVHDEYGGA